MPKDYKSAIDQSIRIIDAWLPAKIKYARVPGLSVGIVYRGQLVYSRGFGLADVEKSVTATPETCYRVASISKTFTAVAIMQLVEQGKLKLDDKVVKYLPWFKVKTKKLDSRRITVRQLLAHSSGVFRDGDKPQWEDDHFPNLATLKKSIGKLSLVFKPASKFKYSNFGYALLGQVISAVSGMSYDEYVTKNIIDELKLKRTYPDLTTASKKYLASGYWRPIPDKKREKFSYTRTNTYASAAGFISNVKDLAIYLSALSLHNNKLLAKSSKQKMFKKQMATGEDKDGYGLGFELYKIEKRQIVNHGGGFPGFITNISLDIDNDIGVIVLANTNYGMVGNIASGILSMVYKLKDGKNKYCGNKNISQSEKYEGVYRERWLDRVVVSLGGNLLSFASNVDSPIRYGTVFQPVGRNKFLMHIKYNFDATGEYAEFVFGKDKKRASKLIWGATPADRISD